MSSPADNRAYFESIQNYFLERTGKGLMLSSRDLELLLGWRQSGATVHAVCRGIDEAVDRLTSGPRDLYAVRKFVDQHLAASRSAAPVFERRDAPAAGTSDPLTAALETVVSAIDEAARPEISASLHEVARRLREAIADDAEPWSVLGMLDDFLVQDVFERLPEDERRLIDMAIEASHGPRLAVMNEEARRATLFESRRAELGRQWSLVSLIE